MVSAKSAKTNAMIHAMKNISIFGGFVMLAAVGAGRYSIDGPCTVHQPQPSASAMETSV